MIQALLHRAPQPILLLFVGLALITGVVLAAPVGLPGSPASAHAALASPESMFLYVSAGAVRSFDVATGTAATFVTVPDVVPGMPSRALSGKATSYSVRPLSGPMRTYLTEEATHPGQPTAHVLTADLAFASRVSPDGGTLLYVVEEFVPDEGIVNNLYLWSAATESAILKLENADGADWSPDGTRIAYLSYPRAAQDPQMVMLYLYDRATGFSSKVSTARLTALHEVNIYSPRWSPSGQWIAFQRYDFEHETVSLVRTNPAGTAETVLLTAPMGTVGQGMEWVRLPGGGERLYVESLVPGGAPYVLVDVGGVGPGSAGPDVLHGAFSFPAQPKFVDVGPSGTFAREIYDLASLRVVGGFDDGSFRPGQPVKRMQYAKMITIALGLHDAAWTNYDHPTFPDVPPPPVKDDASRYPWDYIEEAAAAGLVKGDTAGRFKPAADISRVQLALMIARAGQGQLDPATPSDYQTFGDTAGLTQEARDAVALAYHNGIIKGKTAAAFQPYATATRGQVAVMTWRLMKALGLLG
ncbi:MAG: S-layer homology domain-containing protein [Thermoleophilia bacterium]|nr:S-layer homology domain-containing protein [Thermoleophilia bacterium]